MSTPFRLVFRLWSRQHHHQQLAGGETTLLATACLVTARSQTYWLSSTTLTGHLLPRIINVKHTAYDASTSLRLASKRDAQRVHVHKRTQEDQYVMLAFESAPQVTEIWQHLEKRSR